MPLSRRVFSVAAFALASLVVLGSLGPFEFREDFGGSLRHPIVLFSPFAITGHRLLHFLAFGILGMLVVLISPRPLHWLLGWAAVVALGLSIESLQYLFSTNPFETWDLRDDVCAALAGHLSAIGYVGCRNSLRQLFFTKSEREKLPEQNHISNGVATMRRSDS